MSLAKEDFNALIKIIKDRSGIALAEDKEYLLEGRLLSVTRKYSLEDVGALVRCLKEAANEEMVTDIIEAMTTNESFFFRDIKPFTQLSQIIIPDLLKKTPNKKDFRIWSAACSSGQEPYSILMTLDEDPQCKDLNFTLLATDIDEHILQKARGGLYTQFEVQRGVPVTRLLKYFTQEGERWRIRREFTAKVEFRQFNLMDDSADLGQFDIIFCRNVLIYFDLETKRKVLHRISQRMGKHSALFLGAAESTLGMDLDLIPYPGTTGIFCRADS